ncbi:anhydro-N-acetylmuramic acid kinase [Flavobacterium sp. DG1-102-2]|uniref:anhydro-N-acetylmuramic acid kinase n=1 Tax=Flavobacterium sp. DG1-102-2 TaxID=3081663 RepID=UPI00294983F8|nr:anhydro-N-acetylmuramic acid kinase [Flavobacterium sp. DG1-102-2]MDV6168214.1 anhydro-N-acetylmuramic acid kinase [Flavobacterium sp. DG1-102-2]
MKENYNVVGVMSGTSLDGVDLAHILFEFKDSKWQFSIEKSATIPYSHEWVERLKTAISFDESELKLLNEEYTQLLGGIIAIFIDNYNLTGLDAVCSHGHTILHQPQNGFTLQIGNLPEIASIINQKVVCNFRVQDVQLGGQGAPLVPIGDRLLFSAYDYCLNLGGFSNISFEKSGNRIAFDICPVNTVLNFYANQLGFEYDTGGKIASKGFVQEALLEELNNLGFYKQDFPKSLGFEFVKEVVLPLIEKYPASAEDRLATFTEHIAVQIANVINAKGKGRLLITGGGAYNTFLIVRLKELLADTTVTIPDDKIIQFKEALIFAFLGVLKLRDEINVLNSVTGAKRDHSSGYVFLP